MYISGVGYNGVMQIFLVALLTLGGMGLSVQQAVNSRLRLAVHSPVLGALISFVVGGLALAVLAAFNAFGRGRLTGLGPLPWWAWTGGLFGAFYVTLAVIGVPRVGTAVVVACAVFGQLAAALALDSFGWLGVPRSSLNVWRVAGALLLFAGVLLMQKK